MSTHFVIFACQLNGAIVGLRLLAFTNRRTHCRPPPGSNSITEDTRLLLYALHEQATKGPCGVSRPWGLFDGEEALQWDAWKTLGDMPAMEAMQLHCKTVEVDNPEWW